MEGKVVELNVLKNDLEAVQLEQEAKQSVCEYYHHLRMYIVNHSILGRKSKN